MKSQILEILKNAKQALSVHEINDLLGLKDIEQFKTLVRTLNEMEDALEIYKTNKDNFMLFENSHLKVGTVIGKKQGYAFVDVEEDEDVFVASSNLNGAMHQDKVIVEVTAKTEKGLEGRIVKVVDRTLKQAVGEFYYHKKTPCVKLDDEKYNIELVIKKDKTLGAMDGHKVLVKITRPIKPGVYEGEVLRILGHKNDPGIDILSIVLKYGIHDTYPEEVMKETDLLPNEVSKEEMTNRRDLRDEMIFTIDGSHTKDIDDAISIKKLENGNYQLGVHIADVSHYVKKGSKLYEEAKERGTSVYLADRVIPMLPHKLSNGICSLNPSEDRLAESCIMEIDSKGKIVSSEIFESVIRSKKQMTYDAVNEILEQNTVPEGYEEFADTLRLMSELADILRKEKIERGYIDFDIDEPEVVVNEKGEAIDVVVRPRGKGEKLIEDFMIAANETVATTIYFMELPFIYRVHGEPSEEKVKQFLNFVSSLGYTVKGNLNKLTPKEMQKILGFLNDKKEYGVLSNLMLRSMQKAVYDTNNIGHFGLASKCYTHFTSPIRRFPDTTVHRLLRNYLFESKMDVEFIKQLETELKEIAAHSSEMERTSIDCEREVTDMKIAEYMEKHIGEIYTGMISTVTNFGLFVQLPNLIEGLIHIDDLTDDHYIYDEATFTLRGVKNKKGYRLGDTVEVIVKRASKEDKQVDFVIADEKNKKIYAKEKK
jgi:ribonuclease R